MNDQPIGILDSGIGGLTVWKEIAHHLPHESIIYIGDSKNAPYGKKSPDEVYFLARKLISFLISKRAKAIIIACNTITVCCLEKLRNEFKYIPILGTVPVVKTAGELTKNKKIGILSTTLTANSQYQAQLISKFLKDCDVINSAADNLVPLVESGKLSGIAIRKELAKALKPFKKREVDVVVLGCTHFPFLRKRIQEIMGEETALLDSGAALARQTKKILTSNNILASYNKANYEFYTSGDPDLYSKIFKKLLGSKFTDLPLLLHFATFSN